MKIGFLGLGVMGLPMAINVLKRAIVKCSAMTL
jgi:3-hydroxyisobutyrate dehydrogenase-like beta-hydroxyacid dehydrogenase